jgi:hypothetical protein
MSEMTIGWIITVVGIVVTIVTLCILWLVINLMSRMFPNKDEENKK